MELGAAVVLGAAPRRTSQRRHQAAKASVVAAAGLAVYGLTTAFCAPALGAGPAATIDGAVFAAARAEESGASTGVGVAAVLAGAGAYFAMRGRQLSVQQQSTGAMHVRQWCPEDIPPSERRASEDRVRMKIHAHHPMPIQETVEVLQDVAQEVGGEIEGPIIMAKKKQHWYVNKGPKGHKRSKNHFYLEDHTWILDFYPPVDGNLDSLMKVKLPHTVDVEFE